jgi:hypothetical protein
MTTLGKIGEEIIRRYNNGDPSYDSSLEPREVYQLVIQAINRRIKIEHLSVNNAIGEMVPPNSSLWRYKLDVNDLSAPQTRFERKNIGAPMTDNYYTTPEGLYWVDGNGDYIVGEPAKLNVAIEQLEISSEFRLTLYPFNGINGITSEVVANFLIDNSKGVDYDLNSGYIELQGADANGLYRIPTICISNVTFTATEVSFIFDLNDNRFDNEAVKQAVSSSIGDIIYNDGQVLEIDYVSIDFYEAIEEVRGRLKSFASLNAYPIALPRGLGIWRVYPVNKPTAGFIPIQSGENGILDGMMSSSLDELFTYEYQGGNNIYFNKERSDVGSEVYVELVGVNANVHTDPYTPLPIPADMEYDVIVDVLKVLGVKEKEDNINDGNPDNR